MEKMHIHPLDIPVSRICLGTWAFSGFEFGGCDVQSALATLQSAYDHGINFIDTAPVYGFGRAEEIIGQSLKLNGSRNEIVLATKVGLDWTNHQFFRNATAKRIAEEINASLKRLQTDYIDIYQVHWPDPLTPIEETAEAMLQLFKAGKIRAIGVSNFTLKQLQTFRQVAPIHTSQPPYNLFERDIEKDIFPFTEEFSIPTLAYSALCRGLLSGNIAADREFPTNDVRYLDPKYQPGVIEQYVAAVDALSKFAQREYGKSILALAIRWILDHGRTIAIWGARSPAQLKTINEIADWTIDADTMKLIDHIVSTRITTPISADFLAPPTRKQLEKV